jgi:hypothetical protein
MDQLFPTSMDPHLVPLSNMIDCTGFVELCCGTYDALLNADDKLERLLSEPEFVLCCAWILVRHLLRVRLLGLNYTVANLRELLDAIPQEFELPAPITHYLECLGVVRHPNGAVLVPNIVLPRMDPPQNYLTGMLPSTSLNQFANVTQWEFNSAMIQFGMLGRAIVNAHAQNGNYAHQHALDQLDANHANAADDAHYARPGCLPKFTGWRPMHRDRIGRLTNPFIAGPGLLPSIWFNHQLFLQFQLFLDRCRPKVSMLRIPLSTAGSPAYFAWAVPQNGDANIPATSYFYYSTVTLSNAEQHAARLFRYRTQRSRNENCAEPDRADRDAVYTAAHVHLQGPTMTITTVPSMPIYLLHYIRHFVKA